MSYFFSLSFCSLPVFSGCQAWGMSEILLVSKMGGGRSLWTTKASPPPLESLPAQRLPFPFSALEQGVKPSTVLVPDQGLVLASSPGGWTRTVPALRWRQRHRHRSQVHSSTNGLGTKPSQSSSNACSAEFIPSFGVTWSTRQMGSPTCLLAVIPPDVSVERDLGRKVPAYQERM